MKKRTEKEIAIRKAYIDGFRPYVAYHPVGIYRGCFHKSSLQGYGIKFYVKKKLIYDGEWLDSKCHGQGTLRRINDDGTSSKIYVGQWIKGKRCGEGKMYHRDGVYYGCWKDDKHHGKGIMWYKDGSIYIGEWKNGLYNGAGVFFYINGNRYEGFFENNLKHGEGLFFHNNTGQVQKGVWFHDVCKTSIMFDEFRNRVQRPTPYPLPQNEIINPDKLVKELFREYLPPIQVEAKSTITRLDLLSKIRMKFLSLKT